MILKLYIIRDEVALDNTVLLSAKNDAEFRRNIKALLVSPSPNYINQNTKDKRVFYVGDQDTETGVITGFPVPQPLMPLEEIRQELEDEIVKSKSDVMLKAISHGFKKEDAQAYLNLFESSNFYDLKTSREVELEKRIKELDFTIKMLEKEREVNVHA